MKKLVLGAAAAAAVAAPLALMPTMAGATGTTTGNSVTISTYADYGLAGSNLDIELQVRCTGGTGLVQLQVDQYYPETPIPTGAHGFGATEVVCDGRTRLVNGTVTGVVYDGGKAKATATLLAPSGTKTTMKWITIRAH